MFDDINDLWATNYSFESMTNAAKGIKSHSANLPAKKGGKNKIDEKSLAKLLSKSMTIESDGDEPFANSANIMIPVENIGYQALLRTRKWAPGILSSLDHNTSRRFSWWEDSRNHQAYYRSLSASRFQRRDRVQGEVYQEGRREREENKERAETY
jgi:hypothetical protein